ncbi:SigE family RNA polymerase sigma factor [Dactylosporangium vinaceum]|uniref:SigE family RNA polymerase sigma factor n=1 Tax=Dactylosporangium vinaceum TaxID=53362 RepID=A0ABV5MHR4_9ACTN|nr:SigE family RNA polymerase sigma factor [Dactylosporangium vinaceum]UAB99114.1 SigE family RNA polymerase sigma factor [Dactylosporangium vinaceum]
MPQGESDDQRQFREYFTARHDAVRRTAYVLCGDWHWADDLTQNAFIRLAAGWRRVRDREALDGFVRTCLVRAYLSDVKRVWRRRERSVAEPPDVAGPGSATDRADGRMTFEAALRTLPPRQRVVLLCRYYQDLDVAETAATLGCSQGTVKSQAARGLAKLRDLLGERDDDDSRTTTMLGGRS